MLYLVISTPHPSKPEDVKNARLEFRSWIKDLKSENKVICFYPRVGRGSIVILTKLRLKPTSCEEHGYLFSGMKKRIRVSQLMARVKAGGKALENLPVIYPSRV
jgi:hypothetical protein